MNFKPGDRYNFDDGGYIEVIQIKNAEHQGENTQMVTYYIGGPKNLPRKLVMEVNQFISNFGHLFQGSKE
jgi:hypothetical protein